MIDPKESKQIISNVREAKSDALKSNKIIEICMEINCASKNQLTCTYTPPPALAKMN